MPKGDKVRVGFGTTFTAKDNVPIYDVATNPDGTIVFDSTGGVTPRVIGGVKGGSTGEIVGGGVRVLKSLLKSYGDGAAAMALDYVMLFPVMFDYYKQVAWVPSDHVHITG